MINSGQNQRRPEPVEPCPEPVEGQELMHHLATTSIAAGTPLDWYEQLYADAERGTSAVPWDHGEPTPILVDWLEQRFPGEGRGSAIIVGCAFGDDAELTARYGFKTTAFDISTTAVRQAQLRHAGSAVQYHQADLLELPTEWRHGFDLVIECTTLQCLPPELHKAAARGVSSLCAPGGVILVVARIPKAAEPPGPPWLLTEAEVKDIAVDGVRLVDVKKVPMRGGPRWQAEFTRPQRAASDPVRMSRPYNGAVPSSTGEAHPT